MEAAYSTAQQIRIMHEWEDKCLENMRADITRVVENALIQKAHGDTYVLGMLWKVARMPMVEGVTTYQRELLAELERRDG